MHEAGLITELLDSIRRELAARGLAGGRVRKVALRVGRLAGADPEALRFAFAALAPGTELAGAELEIETPPLVGRCRACGARAELADPLAPCPRCGADDLALEGGREMLLQALEVEPADGS